MTLEERYAVLKARVVERKKEFDVFILITIGTSSAEFHSTGHLQGTTKNRL